MTIRLNWRYVAETVGVIAIVLSLTFVGLQMRQTQAIAFSEVWSANVGHRIEANNAIAENSELWTKANLGEELSASEILVIDRLVENLTISSVAMTAQFLELGREQDAETTLTDFASFLYQNPGIYQHWLKREQRFVVDRIVVMGAEDSFGLWLKDMTTRVEKLEKAHVEI